jgi:hypothetical protein
MLAIARALVVNPRLLLLDEPMEGLAPIIVQDLMKVIRNLMSEGGMAVVVVEQHAKLALTLDTAGDRARQGTRGSSRTERRPPERSGYAAETRGRRVARRCKTGHGYAARIVGTADVAVAHRALTLSPPVRWCRSTLGRAIRRIVDATASTFTHCGQMSDADVGKSAKDASDPRISSFVKMLCACVLTVMSLMASLRPISLLVMPRRIQEAISSCRGESCAPCSFAVSIAGSCAARVLVGLRNDLPRGPQFAPRCTARDCRQDVLRRMLNRRHPLAPCRSARSTNCSVNAAEKTNTLLFGLEAFTRINVPTSLALNEVASSSRTSGCHSRASRTVSASVYESPTSATSPFADQCSRSRCTGLSRGAQERDFDDFHMRSLSPSGSG